MIALAAEGIGVSLGGRRVLEDVHLSAAGGEMIGVIGPNGAGKSTLLRVLAGMLPAAGNVVLDGVLLSALSWSARSRRIAYLPQARLIGFPMRVRDVVALGRLPHGESDRETAIAGALECCDLAHLAERPVDTVSEGERARVLLARALAQDSPLLLADEPTAALDPYHQHAALRILCETTYRGRLVIAALHDLRLAMRYCSRIVLLDGGRVMGDGTPPAVLSPANLEKVFRLSPGEAGLV